MDDLLVQKNALYRGPPSGPVNQHEPMSRHDEILTKVIAKARVNITNLYDFCEVSMQASFCSFEIAFQQLRGICKIIVPFPIVNFPGLKVSGHELHRS